MPRFVLLYHDCPPSFGKPSHWDLMLERDGALMTWSLAELPKAWQLSPDAADPDALVELHATRLADHRLAYLDYEGPVSGDRGRVTRHDHGAYVLVEERADQWRVRLHGAIIRGVVTLPMGEAPSSPA